MLADMEYIRIQLLKNAQLHQQKCSI